MHATSPEIGAIEVFLGVVSKQVLHVPADERRCVVPSGLEAIDDGWRAREQMLNAIPCSSSCFFSSLALADITPRPDHLGRLTIFVPDQPLCIIDPAVGTV